MRLVLISDTHEMHQEVEVPEGDVLIHAGDMSFDGDPRIIRDFNEWLGEQTHKHKVVIAGNHDWVFERDPKLGRSLLTNATYLEEEGVEIDGMLFWGSPIQPTFCNWAFNRDRGAPIRIHWNRIPDDVDVLITHGPPGRFLDTSRPGAPNLGCEDLREAVLRIKPKLHVFGHIHGGYGQVSDNGTTFVNASVVNEAYRVKNAPIVIDL